MNESDISFTKMWHLAPSVAMLVLAAGCSGARDSSGGPTLGSAAPDTVFVDSSVGVDSSVPVDAVPESSKATSTIERTVIGRSIEGRPIEVWHRIEESNTSWAASDSGLDESRIVVLVIGSIHGNEPAGLDIVDVLADMPADEIARYGSIDLWLMPTGNPDGIAAGTRHNAREVDLNRNFPSDWAPLQRPGDYEYSGTGPASEPETQALMAFIEHLRPDLTVWFHQDAYRVAPSWRADREVREMYAYLTRLPLLAVEGGTYTGVAATWHRRTFDAVSFIVELGRTLSKDEAVMHARAVLAVTSVLPE